MTTEEGEDYMRVRKHVFIWKVADNATSRIMAISVLIVALSVGGFLLFR